MRRTTVVELVVDEEAENRLKLLCSLSSMKGENFSCKIKISLLLFGDGNKSNLNVERAKTFFQELQSYGL